MMLKTSSRKLDPAFKMFSFTLKKNISLIILLSVITLVYCPGLILANIDNITAGLVDGSVTKVTVFNDFGVPITVLAGIFVVVFNLINFMFLYSKKSSDVFLSFPLTRTELLLSRFFAGFMFTMIPVLLGYGSLYVLTLVYDIGGSGIQVLLYLCYTVATVLVFSSFSLIFVVCAGSAFDLAVSFIGGNIAVALCCAIVEGIASDTLVGYYSDDVFGKSLKILSPFYLCWNKLFNLADRDELVFTANDGRFFLHCAVITVIFLLASVLLFRRRKAERGGDAYAYRFIYYICSLMAGFCGAYAFGLLFCSESFDVKFWIFAVIGAIIITVIYGAVTDRGFKTAYVSVIIGVCSVIIMAGITVAFNIDFMGYTAYIPKSKDISSVKVVIDNETVIFDDPAKVTALHTDILSDGKFTNEYGDYSFSAEFIYDLKNSKNVKRRFYVRNSDDKLEKSVRNILASDERFEEIEKKISASKDKVDIIYSSLDGSFDIATYASTAEIKEFLKIYRENIEKVPDVSLLLKSDDQSGMTFRVYIETLPLKPTESYCFYIDPRFTDAADYLNSLDLESRESEDTVYYK